MPLTDIPLPDPADAPPLPADVTAFLANAEARIDRLFDSGQQKRTPRYLPSDPKRFYHALAHLTAERIPLGDHFCEWGSGLGVNTSLASLLGYQAYGIEIEPSLVQIATDLAHDNNVPSAHFAAASYIPEGVETYDAIDGPDLADDRDQLEGEAFTYPGVPFATDEFDVVFNYPWPTEQEFSQKLFEHVAADGTVLLTYWGDGELTAHLKTPTDAL